MTTLNSLTGATGPLHQSPEWRALRVTKLNSTDWRCEACRGRNSRNNVHHKKSVRMFPHLALDYGNLVVLCAGCHESLHAVARNPALLQLVKVCGQPEILTAHRLDFGPVPIQFGL